MAKTQLKRLVEDKCRNGYGVDLKQLLLLGWRLLSPNDAKKTGDLQPDILDDPQFIGCLQIPMVKVDGTQIKDHGKPFHRYRLFFEYKETVGFGGLTSDPYKKKRYRQALNTDAHPFLPQNLDLKTMAKNTSEVVYLIEGEPKCMAMSLLGYFTIGLSGVEMFSVKGDPLPELLDINWQGRDVIICFDNDWHTNGQVKGAIQRVGRQVMMLGGNVYVVDLPEDGPKGIDEYLNEYGPEALEGILEEALPYDVFATFDSTDSGIPRKTAANVQLGLMKLGHEFRLNLLTDEINVLTDGKTEPLSDRFYSSAMVLLDVRYKLQPAKQMLFDVVDHEAKQNSYHPIKEYLQTCVWDGTKRLSQWLEECFGVEDNPLNRAISRLTLLGPAARVLKPGCKFDTITILVGKQGTLKSTILRSMCPDETWFTDSIDINDNPREFIEHTHGKWIVEASELDHMTKGETGKIKANVSRQTDRARAAYGRVTKDVPRSFAIIGTANASVFLKDMTGNRRFLPITCPDRGNIKWVNKYRDQLWAEAIQAVEGGEQLYLPEDLWESAEVEQESRMVHTPIYEQLVEWFESDNPGKVSAFDIWAGLGKVEVKDRNPRDAHEIREGMEALEFKKQTVNVDGKRCTGYVRMLNYDEKKECSWKLAASSEGSFIMKYQERSRKRSGPVRKLRT